MTEHFHFLRPLWFLALPPLAWLLWRAWHRRHQGGAWRSVCDAHLLPYLLVGMASRAARTPLVLLGLAGVLTIVALAGPVWSKLPQPVYRHSAATVVLLSLSGSMNASDLAPTRLERAKLKLLDFLHRQREGQTALVVYAGEAYVVSPLTDDAATIASLVSSLQSDLMPVTGNRLSEALRKADALLDQDGVVTGGRILLMSDSLGDSAALADTAALRKKDRTLSVLGIGTDEGAPVPAATGGFVKGRGEAILIPKLERDALQQLASLGRGRFMTLTVGDEDLNHLWPARPSSVLSSEHKDENRLANVWREEGPWLLLMVLPLAALFFRRGWLNVALIAMIAGMPHPAQAFEWHDLWARPDQQAYQALQRGDAKTAAQLFHDERWRNVARYRSGDYASAAAGFGDTKHADDLYNRGNALARGGKLEEAAEAYRQVLQQHPDHDDAKYNLGIVEDMLKRQQQKSSPSKGNKSAPDNQDKSQPGVQASQDAKAQSESNGQRQSRGQNAQPGDQSAAQSQSPAEQRQGQGQQQAMARAEGQNNKDENTPARAAQKSGAASTAADEAKRGQDKPGQSQNSETANTALNGNNESSQTDVSAEHVGTEADQALQQWLRRIPDDPGGLLRRKFMLQHQQYAHQ